MIAAVLLFLIFMIGEYSRLGDFHIYYIASSLLFDSETAIYKKLYGTPAVFEYYGSPFLTLVLHPFTLLPVNAAALLWKLINIIAFIRIWQLTEQYFDIALLTRKKRNVLIVVVFISLSFAVYTNFHSLQFTFILLYTVLEGLNLIYNKNLQNAGALLVSIGILTKLTPVVVLPYLIYRTKFKSVLFIILFTSAFMFLPSLFTGWQKNELLWSEWLAKINPHSDVNTYDMNNSKNHGLSALVASLFIDGINHSESPIHLRRHIVDLNPETVKYILSGVRLFFISLTLYFLQTLPFKSQPDKLHRLWEVSYILLVAPLLLPQQRPYNFLLLLPAIAYCIYFFTIDNKNNLWKITLFISAIIIINLELILGHFREYFWHYKTLTFGTFIILFLLIILHPDKLKFQEITL